MNKSLMMLVVVGSCLSTSCINEETHLYEVALSGQIAVAGGFSNKGEVFLQFHHESSVGAGELAHPLGEFEEMTLSSIGPTSQSLLYPKDEGAGLVVYGWLDVDGDGVLCAPGKPRTEPAGLVVVDGFPAHSVSYTLVLDTACAGPESLYP